MEVNGQKIASMGKRALGGFIDLILCFIITALIGKIFGATTIDTSDGSAKVSVTGFPAILGAIIAFGLLGFMEFKTGKSPAKFLLGMKVISEDGSALTMKQSMQRNFMRFIDSLFFYLVGFVAALSSGDKKQRFGDKVAKTIVVAD